MTSADFRRRRLKLFKTQLAAATAMGVTRPTISFWENGKHPIPGWAVKMLELLEREASLHKSIKRASDIH